MGTIAKRQRQAELCGLAEPKMSPADREDFERGVELFNERRFWQAHEAWEDVWKRHPENSRIFFQGLIQVAAGLHQLRRGIFHGADKHLRNALWKLKPFPASFLGVDVATLVRDVEATWTRLTRLGPRRLHQVNEETLPTIRTVSS